MNVLSWENISKLEGQNVMVLDGAENEFDVMIESVEEHDRKSPVQHAPRLADDPLVRVVLVVVPNHVIGKIQQNAFIFEHEVVLRLAGGGPDLASVFRHGSVVAW